MPCTIEVDSKVQEEALLFGREAVQALGVFLLELQRNPYYAERQILENGACSAEFLPGLFVTWEVLNDPPEGAISFVRLEATVRILGVGRGLPRRKSKHWRGRL